MRYIYRHKRDKKVSSPSECSWKAIVHARFGRNLKIEITEQTASIKRPKFTYTFSKYDKTSCSAFRPFELDRLEEVLTNLLNDCTAKYYNKPKRIEYLIQKSPAVIINRDSFKKAYENALNTLVTRKTEKLLKTNKNVSSVNNKVENYKATLEWFYNWKTKQFELDLNAIQTNTMVKDYTSRFISQNNDAPQQTIETNKQKTNEAETKLEL